MSIETTIRFEMRLLLRTTKHLNFKEAGAVHQFSTQPITFMIRISESNLRLLNARNRSIYLLR